MTPKIEVFEGDRLRPSPPPSKVQTPRCWLAGKDTAGNTANIPLDDSIFSKHLALLGSIGTGKTNTMFQLIMQIKPRLAENDVMIIFDSKGDFYNAFYQRGDIVISNDNKATGSTNADYWNVFNEIEDMKNADTLEENITEIAKTLFFEKIERSNSPFFPSAAKDLFAATLTHACRGGFTTNNQALRRFLDTATVEVLRDMLGQHNDLQSMLSYVAKDDSGQTLGVISELQQLTREIFLGNFKKPGTLSMRQLVRQKGGKTVFIEYDLGVGNMLTPIYRLLFDMAIKETLSRKKSGGNVWLIADEFRLVPHLQHIDNLVNFGRSLGAKAIIGIQNIDQLYEIYGQHRARSILSGFSTSITFRLNDGASREYVKDLFGQNRKREIFLSTVQSRGVTENIYNAHVVEDWDITRLGMGEAVIGLPGQEPFLFRFDEYK